MSCSSIKKYKYEINTIINHKVHNLSNYYILHDKRIALYEDGLIKICNSKTYKPNIVIPITDKNDYLNICEFIQNKKRNQFVFLVYSEKKNIIHLISLGKENYTIIDTLKFENKIYVYGILNNIDYIDSFIVCLENSNELRIYKNKKNYFLFWNSSSYKIDQIYKIEFIKNASMTVKEIKETQDGQNLILMSTVVHSYITYYYFLNFNLVYKHIEAYYKLDEDWPSKNHFLILQNKILFINQLDDILLFNYNNMKDIYKEGKKNNDNNDKIESIEKIDDNRIICGTNLGNVFEVEIKNGKFISYDVLNITNRKKYKIFSNINSIIKIEKNKYIIRDELCYLICKRKYLMSDLK